MSEEKEKLSFEERLGPIAGRVVIIGLLVFILYVMAGPMMSEWNKGDKSSEVVEVVVKEGPAVPAPPRAFSAVVTEQAIVDCRAGNYGRVSWDQCQKLSKRLQEEAQKKESVQPPPEDR